VKVFIDKKDVIGEIIEIGEEDRRHLVRVLRVRDGDGLLACDGEFDYSCRLTDGRFQIVGKEKCASENKIEITLFQGVPKSSKMEIIIQMCSELGVNRLIPFHSKYCVAELPDEKKLERWRKIARESAVQCGRDRIMEVCGGVEIGRAAGMAEGLDLAFVCWEGEKNTTLKDVFYGAPHALRVASSGTLCPPRNDVSSSGEKGSIGFFVGSEGGFSEDEIEMIGLPTVTLGKRILRTQTVGAVVSGIILSDLGEI